MELANLDQMSQLKQVLLIFIRNPELGKVKTRLARVLGDVETLNVYRFLLERVRAASLGVGAARWLFYSEQVPASDNWPNALFDKKLQASGDLGERMSAAFRAAFEGGANRVLIIGSDCPELSAEVLEGAFQALERHDFVLGPTPDGGYYLLGMKQYQPAVFQEIVWSTDTVRAETLKKIDGLGKTVALLPVLTDMDEAGDWAAYLHRDPVAAAAFPDHIQLL